MERRTPGSSVCRAPEHSSSPPQYPRKVIEAVANPSSKFYRECLPRLKYWNPSVPMIVNRTTNNGGPATMTLYFRQSADASTPITSAQQPSSSMTGASPAAPPLEDERVVHIDMKMVKSDDIWEEFLRKTQAKVLETPEADVEAMQIVQERRVRSEADKVIGLKRRDELRREEELMARAREEAAEMRVEQ